MSISLVLPYRYKLLGLLLCGLVFTGCNSKPPPIDQQYINSGSYSDFHNDIANETHLRFQNNMHLQKLMQQFYDCNKGPKLNSGERVGVQQNTLSKKYKVNNCNRIKDSYILNFNAYIVGYYTYNKLQLRWFLIQNQVLNRCCQLVLAVYKKGHVAGFQSLGSTQSNLLLDVDSSFKILPKSDQLDILVTTTRKVHYPIKQRRKIQTTYSINQSGEMTAGNKIDN